MTQFRLFVQIHIKNPGGVTFKFHISFKTKNSHTCLLIKSILTLFDSNIKKICLLNIY